ncbi:MAG: NUDIX domain-containing protein [Phycisphaerae bacterium]|jgi:mutator protein MutT
MSPNENRRLFKYCPKCGTAALHFVKSNKLVCGKCRFEYYHNNAAAAAAIITNNKGQILFVKRAQEPKKGMLDLPGGFSDHGESAEEAIKREIKEEVCLKTTSVKYLCSYPNIYKYKGVTYSTIDLGFVCKVKDISKAKAKDDAQSIIFISPDKIPMKKIAFKSVKKMISFYLAGL